MDPQNPNWDEDEDIKSVSLSHFVTGTHILIMPSTPQMTLLNNLIASSRESSYWTPDLLIQAIIGIWFAASHQPWINLHFMFLELCARPKYIPLLCAEIAAQEALDYAHISAMPLLDSFMKECVRLNPLDTSMFSSTCLLPNFYPSLLSLLLTPYSCHLAPLNP